ncbi:TonB family protein [Lysobacter pythonis]|uniref:TonB family protein n=1 Tax=Solilutibacter pythonis TaxID=2483112 RepID=A0A3M2HJT8_9GAMM|nr:energy transducer TonB [Lysobacter pythonis]RMH88113.1 TonB family protein [Lysobacter pythonis]
MRIRYTLLSLTLAAAALAAQAAQPALAQSRTASAWALDITTTESVMTMRVDGVIEFDTLGKVTSHQLKIAGLPEAIAKMANEAMAEVEFEPVIRDGKPVNARTFARMTFVARQQRGGGYEVRLERMRFFDGRYDGMGAPKGGEARVARPMRPIAKQRRQIQYPAGLMRAGVSGAVMTELKLRPDGTVEDVFITQSALFNVRGRDRVLDKAREVLEKEVMAAVRTWRFELAPPEPGQPFDGVGQLPVFFVMSGARIDQEGRWRHESRSPRRLAPWALEGDADRIAGISDVGDSEDGRLAMGGGDIRAKSLPIAP